MSPASFLDLPNEIVSEICEYLCFHCVHGPGVSCEWAAFDGETGSAIDFDVIYPPCKQTLAWLCRTSRRMNQVASPILYGFFIEPSFMWTRQQGIKFLHTICHRPDLAKPLKHAILHTYTEVKTEHMPLVFDITESLDIELPQEWRESKPNDDIVDYDRGDWVLNTTHIKHEDQAGLRHGFLVDLFLASAPNLEELALDTSHTTRYGDFMPKGSTLPHLKYLHLRPGEYSSSKSFDLGQVEKLLEKAPNLEKLTIGYCRVISPTSLSFHNLKYLTIYDSLVFPKNIAQSCKNLQRFSFIYPYSTKGHRLYRSFILSFTPKAIVEDLEPWSASLQALRITLGTWPGKQRYHQKDMIASLKGFIALRRLDLDELCLFVGEIEDAAPKSLLVDLLPLSIEDVILRDVKPHLYPATRCLHEQACLGEFPSLKEIQVFDDKAELVKMEDWAAETTSSSSGITS
ncbi:hypothetical protein FDECE_9354 [Fusarium decemcellulare]|nr:hypothetical protein FDECE_9354 [Fusarium decemcellulare]